MKKKLYTTLIKYIAHMDSVESERIQMADQTKLFDEIRNFLMLFWAFGLWPTWPNSKFKAFFIINSILYIVYIFSMFWSIFYFNAEFSHRILSAIVQFLFLGAILTVHFTVIVEAFINRNAQMRLIEKFSYADRLLRSKLQLNISYNTDKSIIFIRFASVMFILVIIRIIFTFGLYFKYNIDIFPFRVCFSASISRVRFIQVLFFIYLLRTRLQLVSDQLNDMLVPYNFHDTDKIFVLDVLLAKRSLYDRLVNLKQVYGELYEICELINVTFGWSLLTIIVQSLIDFTSNCYWFYLALKESMLFFAIVCIIVLLPTMLLVVSMAYISSSCSYCVSYCT